MSTKQTIVKKIKYINEKIFYIILINFIFLTFTQESKETKIKYFLKINNQIVTSVDILDEINYLGTINEEYKKLDKKMLLKLQKNLDT